jgi:hypothetical protein
MGKRLGVGDAPGQVGLEPVEVAGDPAMPDAFGDRVARHLEPPSV